MANISGLLCTIKSFWSAGMPNREQDKILFLNNILPTDYSSPPPFDNTFQLDDHQPLDGGGCKCGSIFEFVVLAAKTNVVPLKRCVNRMTGRNECDSGETQLTVETLVRSAMKRSCFITPWD